MAVFSRNMQVRINTDEKIFYQVEKKMKTYLAKVGEIKPECLLFDASEMPVGRLAVRIANALRGKDKPTKVPATV